jgi:hypothetical protein
MRELLHLDTGRLEGQADDDREVAVASRAVWWRTSDH